MENLNVQDLGPNVEIQSVKGEYKGEPYETQSIIFKDRSGVPVVNAPSADGITGYGFMYQGVPISGHNAKYVFQADVSNGIITVNSVKRKVNIRLPKDIEEEAQRLPDTRSDFNTIFKIGQQGNQKCKYYMKDGLLLKSEFYVPVNNGDELAVENREEYLYDSEGNLFGIHSTQAEPLLINQSNTFILRIPTENKSEVRLLRLKNTSGESFTYFVQSLEVLTLNSEKNIENMSTYFTSDVVRGERVERRYDDPTQIVPPTSIKKDENFLPESRTALLTSGRDSIFLPRKISYLNIMALMNGELSQEEFMKRYWDMES